MHTLESLSVPTPPRTNGWADVKDGVVILPRLIPDSLITAYTKEWSDDNGFKGVGADGVIAADNPGGYNDTAYLSHRALWNLVTCQPLADALQLILGEPAGVHLNLTGWVSTERDFHQDGYLNEDGVGDAYAAVWIALGPIAPDAGPFEYIPGSQAWGRTITKELIGQVVDLRNPAWPKHSEDVLVPIIQDEVTVRRSEIVSYLPRRGDVLIWDPLLFHRGSLAVRPNMYRPSCIAHFSGINTRGKIDMPRYRQSVNGGWAFMLNGGEGFE